MTPASAYNDAPLAVAISGDGFRPTYGIDAHSGAAVIDPGGFTASLSPSAGTSPPIPLAGVTWQSLGLLAAQLPVATPAGSYDLIVHDPRGRTSTLTKAFQSLGADTTAPVVRILSPVPNTIFAQGATVPVVVVADDGSGTVTALDAVLSSGSGAIRAYHCAPTGQAVVSCAFSLPAPALASNPDMLTIDVTATGSGAQTGAARGEFALLPAPTFNSFDPPQGSTGGGTPVHITAGNLVQDRTQVTFDGVPATVVDWVHSGGDNGGEIDGVDVLTPEHPMPGPVIVAVTVAGVTVKSGSRFTYLAPPFVREIIPASGPAAGLFPVTVIGDNFAPGTTAIVFGSALLRCAQVVNANRIDGLAPPGTGTQAVYARDDNGGIQPGATVPFQYLQDGGSGPDAASIGLSAAATVGDAGCAAGGP